MPRSIRIADLPLSTRPREKLLAKGPANLTEVELLAILLGTGTLGSNALRLAAKICSTMDLKELNLNQLKSITGVGQAKRARILAAVELGRRLFSRPSLDTPTILTLEDIVSQVREIASKKQEYLVALYLNARRQVLRKETVGIGNLNANLVEPREILAPALVTPCAGFILVHNHPSGDPTPSADDVRFTVRLQKAAQIIGLELLNHVVISGTQAFSFKDQGLLQIKAGL